MNAQDQPPRLTPDSQLAIEDEDTYLPPRKAVHPSEYGKWTRIFYLTLLWLFIMLVIGLTVWGIRYT
ncbi:hypothetical protein [Paenibacillus aestuarii]|uniref:Uncharacterized protein n=1 Tax=Paenibacillus aestuarii TaxID=516965 RepID=A0ABW0K460_9BACL|nr:hypothetical protein [Paenibacillus aestuarii]